MDCGTKYQLVLIKSDDDVPPTLPRSGQHLFLNK
jgi:hypothetical protein